MAEPGVRNRLSEIRNRNGLSAAALASRTGVTRQTVYAIEAGRYMPNTALALRFARELAVRVEDLFELEAAAPDRTVDADLISGPSPSHQGQPVQLCVVGRRTVAVPAPPVPVYLPLADGVLAGRSVLSFRPEPLPKRLLIAGCDPALSLLAWRAARAGVDVALASANSSQALALLKAGRIHIAGTHLRDDLRAVRKAFPRGGVRIVTFAAWREGLVVAPHNPKGIRSVAALARRGVRIVNREPGAGSRILLDAELSRAGVKSRAVAGYDRIAHGHLPAAWQVLNGLADCCIASEAAARAFGLAFVPLAAERFDLVIPEDLASSAQVERLIDAMQALDFRHELEVTGGYDTGQTGRLCAAGASRSGARRSD